jgi:DNA-binding beta-propeller fold protein YncE
VTPRSSGLVVGAIAVAVALSASVSSARAPGGGLAQLGCLRAAANAEHCARAVAIGGGPVVVSADGRSVYVGGQTSVAVFARRPGGVLRQLGGRNGCIDYHLVVGEPRANARCASGKLLWPTSAALSPDGRNLYLASWAFDPHGDRSDNYSDLAVFARNRTTGALRQLGCLGPTTRGGCTAGRALSGPESVVVSPDGHNVYVGSSGGLAVFSRNGRTGALRQPAGTAGALRRPAPVALAVSADGRNVYAVTASGDREALAVFRRNRTSGALTRTGTVTAGFVGPSFCYSLALSPDGRSLYVGSCGDLTVFSRNAAGGLRQIGCLDATGPPGHPCAGDTGTEPQTGIAVSRDGRNLYFAFNIGRGSAPGGITVFSRAADGSLTRLAGAAGCLTETGSHGACTKARGLESPHALALSPDGRNLYSSGFAGRECCRDGDVAIFRRTP